MLRAQKRKSALSAMDGAPRHAEVGKNNRKCGPPARRISTARICDRPPNGLPSSTCLQLSSTRSPPLFLKSCYSGQFLAERLVAPGSPALLVFVYVLLMFLCHGAASVTKSIGSGKVAVMTKLQVVTKSVFASVAKFVSESVWAVGAEVAAA